MKTTRASLITKCVILILIVYLSITLLNVRGKLQTASDTYADLQAQVTAQAAENAALEERLENQDDNDTVLAIAKEKLGLVEEGEVVFYSAAD
ncbi:MAG: septum formation initiator family protein [Clostridiales bacterium]|nr:septum formation initiator family protein [Clostridiales bacterium]